MREKQNGMYQVSAYYVAKSVVELPLQVLSPILYSCMFYWMVGLRINAGKFWIFLAILTEVRPKHPCPPGEPSDP